MRLTTPQHVRIARPARNLDATAAFYTLALGFKVIGEFKQHAGFDGLMLAFPGTDWHLEFTHTSHLAPSKPSNEDLLVLYFSTEDAYSAAFEMARRANATTVKSINPYWDDRGVTFEDPDGYRIVLHRGPWSTG